MRSATRLRRLHTCNAPLRSARRTRDFLFSAGKLQVRRTEME
jgi:hypothetical protein